MHEIDIREGNHSYLADKNERLFGSFRILLKVQICKYVTNEIFEQFHLRKRRKEGRHQGRTLK